MRTPSDLGEGVMFKDPVCTNERIWLEQGIYAWNKNKVRLRRPYNIKLRKYFEYLLCNYTT